MTCFLCKGRMLDGFTTHVTDLGSCIIIVKNVPCFKCEQCGEVTYIGTVAKQLEKIIDTLQSNITEIAVVNYSEKVA